MRRVKVAATVCCLLVTAYCFFPTHAFAGDFTFRKTTWGMSKEEVIKAEQLELNSQNDGVLFYESKITDKDVVIVYFFVDDKLVRSRIGLNEKHSNKNNFINDFNDFKKLLIKKYGKPTLDTHHWRDDLYKGDKQNEGLAISMGHMAYIATWATPSTNIGLLLSGENFSIRCFIEYTSNELGYLENIQIEKNALEQL